MIDPEMAMTIVTTVGFPIAVTGFLLWERREDRKEQTKELQSQHEQTRETVQANTNATNRLCIMLEGQMKKEAM